MGPRRGPSSCRWQVHTAPRKLTTPEVLTQIVMGVALQLLYEASVWIAYYWEWKAKKAENAQKAQKG